MLYVGNAFFSTDMSDANVATPGMVNGIYDPQLMADPNVGNWTSDLMGQEGAQFAFIPQGGDMM